MYHNNDSYSDNAVRVIFLYQEDDDVSQCPSEYELNMQDNGFLSRNDAIKSKVSKLTERLRKRYPANNLGRYLSSFVALRRLTLEVDNLLHPDYTKELKY